MDTENIVVCDEEINYLLENINYVEGTAEELVFVTDYVEITRILQEIYQWYQIVKFNLNSLKSVSGTTNVIAANSYVIGLLGTGKNLNELMKICMIQFYGEDSKEYERFNEDYVKKEYDDSFSYRLLLRLRNFSQHCHIPISFQNDSFCFDLAQIYNTPHYNYNKTVREQAEKLMEDVKKKTKRNLTLALAPTVASYMCSLYKIFKSFLESIRFVLIEKETNLFNMIKEHPELIEHPNCPDYNDVFWYIIQEFPEQLHAIITSEKPQELLSFWLNDVVDAYKEERKSLKKMTNMMAPI